MPLEIVLNATLKPHAARISQQLPWQGHFIYETCLPFIFFNVWWRLNRGVSHVCSAIRTSRLLSSLCK